MTRFVACVVLLACVAAACGDDDDESSAAGDVGRYCALVRDLDDAGEKAFAELEADTTATDDDYARAEKEFIDDHAADFDELVEVAPPEIRSHIEVLLAAQDDRAAGGEQEDVSAAVEEAETRVGAFEEENCGRS